MRLAPFAASMCREDALEHGDFHPWGVIPFVKAAEPSVVVAAQVRRITPAELRRVQRMTPEERLEEASALAAVDRARRLAPPL